MSKHNFYITTFMFLQIEMIFIKWEQNHRWPNGADINNDYISFTNYTKKPS